MNQWNFYWDGVEKIGWCVVGMGLVKAGFVGNGFMLETPWTALVIGFVTVIVSWIFQPKRD
jgi:hypothetical protein